MASRLPALVFRLSLLVALGVTSALLIDYLRPLPAFCDVGSGCDQVRLSRFSTLFGIPLPIVGLAGLGAWMAVSLWRSERAALLTRLLAVAAGLTGIALLFTQAFVLKVFCKLCVVVDISTIVASIAALSSKTEADTDRASSPRWLWPAATAVSVLLPGVWAALQPSPPVPREIASLWVPGKINVVEFADFQCPFCRALHPLMTELLGEYEGRVHFVRLNMPLASHSNARTAARSYCCADEQGKAPAMADALFASDSLTPEACEKLAATIGLSLPEYRACVASASTDARIDQEIARVKSAGLAGLPTVWIGDQGLVGLQPMETLRDAFAEAARGRSSTRLPTAVLWAMLAAVVAAFGVVACRTSTRTPSGTSH
jgi:predicted DsbA family dithiol-disulfide isomerase/uncharacterized membrane protein